MKVQIHILQDGYRILYDKGKYIFTKDLELVELVKKEIKQ